MWFRIGLPALLALVLAPLARAQTPTAERSQADVAARVQQLLERQKAQTALPDAAPGAPTAVRRASERSRRVGGEARPVSPPQSWRPWSMGDFHLAVPLLWLVVVLAVLVLVAAVLRSLGGRRAAAQRVAAARVTVESAAGPPPPAERRPDHEAHAARGDFALAVQSLLQQSLGLLQERAGPLPIHATARAAVRHARAQALPTEPFAGVVQVAEGVHFGGVPADRELYAAAHAAFEQWRVVCANRP
jgi:hypothetical protein